MGEDKEVAGLFNKIENGVGVYSNFYYSEEFKKAVEHCEKPWNKMKANLLHNYFSSPWESGCLKSGSGSIRDRESDLGSRVEVESRVGVRSQFKVKSRVSNLSQVSSPMLRVGSGSSSTYEIRVGNWVSVQCWES
ncbi:hypothetical protein MTR67_002743 [Solanum verrucosum]|uniref:Uncharacterized protein n=1 Tax=Solanum verrucosum TaxID=315347 RepID=A0AAF0PQR7_SOLVR|nr:hypothetical protein MTR67_002743 [Solanum verrucosum]